MAKAKGRSSPSYKTNPTMRVAAGAVDAGIAGLFVVFLAAFGAPSIGFALGGVYILLRDALPVPQLGFRSIGKRALNLSVEVNSSGSERLSPVESAKRNIPLAAGALLFPIFALIPAVGLYVGTLALIGLPIYETVLVFKDESGSRLGDQLADTRVLD